MKGIIPAILQIEFVFSFTQGQANRKFQFHFIGVGDSVAVVQISPECEKNNLD